MHRCRSALSRRPPCRRAQLSSTPRTTWPQDPYRPVGGPKNRTAEPCRNCPRSRWCGTGWSAWLAWPASPGPDDKSAAADQRMTKARYTRQMSSDLPEADRRGGVNRAERLAGGKRGENRPSRTAGEVLAVAGRPEGAFRPRSSPTWRSPALHLNLPQNGFSPVRPRDRTERSISGVLPDAAPRKGLTEREFQERKLSNA